MLQTITAVSRERENPGDGSLKVALVQKKKNTGASTLKTFHLGSDQKPVDNLGVNIRVELRRLNKSCMVRFITSAFVF